MKHFLLFAVFLASTMLNAQIQEINIEENYVLYNTPKKELAEVPLLFHKDTSPNDIDKETITTLLDLTNGAMMAWLKSRRSYYPLSYTLKFKPKKNGKYKYSVSLSYEGTNSYGGVVENFQQLEFNHKLKETAGSVLLRMN